MSRCRSCKARIRWVIMASGKRMPIDLESTPDGTIVLTERPDGDLTGRVIGKDPGLFGHHNEPRYKSHFSSCPNAAEHRKGK